VVADYLQGLGYRVLTVGDGVEAMEALQGTNERVQLVITDLGMPRMDGRELYRRGRELRPRLGFLFCTGYAREWKDMAGCGDDLTSRVDKPCAIDVLGQKVRELLLRVRAADEQEQGP
jgi:CheY-like chemotaxis protein